MEPEHWIKPEVWEKVEIDPGWTGASFSVQDVGGGMIVDSFPTLAEAEDSLRWCREQDSTGCLVIVRYASEDDDIGELLTAG